MSLNVTRVAILIVAYNGETYLPDCLTSLRQADFSGLAVEIFVLDNASPDRSGELVRRSFPECHVVSSPSNLGFAEGNNFLFREARSRYPETEFVFLLNQDTIVDRNFLRTAVDYCRMHPQSGAVQSLVMLHPETELINTAGNRLHYLGFGVPTQYRQSMAYAVESGVVDYSSGAAVLVRLDVIQQDRLFSPSLFMYLEDAELGWKLHLIDRPPHVCCDSVVFHKYTFSSTLRSYEYLERNRWWLIAVHYKLATILVLLPALLLMEVGQLIYATSQGLLGAKWRAVAGFMHPTFLGQAWVARRRTQSARMVGDRQMLLRWSGTIDSPYLNGWMVRRVANPVLGAWHRLACWCVRW